MSEQINEQSNQEIPTDANPIENTTQEGEQLQKGAIDRNDVTAIRKLKQLDQNSKDQGVLTKSLKSLAVVKLLQSLK